MANLEKVIKVTQSQYNTLVNGGSITVGGVTYTYDSNAIYLIEDNNTYLPTSGGTITGSLNITYDLTVGSDLTVDGYAYVRDSYGIWFQDSQGNGNWGLGVDYYNNELIYIPDGETRPILAEDSGCLIYTEDGYEDDFQLGTSTLHQLCKSLIFNPR